MSNIKFIYFDAANTLIHKPDLWMRFNEVLTKYGHIIDVNILKKQHKLISENVKFPDNTSRDFYSSFNSEVLRSLGVASDNKILDDIYNACTYLPWKTFDDVESLKDIKIPMGIISNFNSSLKAKITSLFEISFKEFVVSENISVAKPDKRIFEYAINKVNIDPADILFIGDSITLDIEPAQSIGMQAYLIDRDGIYPDFKSRINSFYELKNLL